MSVNLELLTPLIVFCVVTLFTPGPNNFMLMTSGLNFGLKRTLPAIFGVVFGFAFLVFCVGAGLGVVFTTYPFAYTILKYIGSLYLLYLAWLIATADPAAQQNSVRKRPMTFFKTVAFQWVNAKGWIMAVSAMSTYALIADYPFNATIIAGVFGFLGIGSSFFWACCGTLLQRFLKKPRIVRAFNIIMAILLVASIYPVFTD